MASASAAAPERSNALHRLSASARVRVATIGTAGPGCGVKDPSAITLSIAAAKITIVAADGARHEFGMDAQGAVAFDGKPFGTLGKDGQLRAGTATVRMVKDGVVLVHGNVSNVTISADATFTLDGAEALRIAADGTITGPLLADMDSPMFVATGATLTYVGPPETRRALMFAFAAALTSAPAQPLPPRP